ncbi:MAG: SURF1 family protein [Novosphingobium sp.]
MIVLAAVAVMMWLGVWQLQRLHWKESLLVRYAAAQSSTAIQPWPHDDIAPLSYSRVRSECIRASGQSAISGQNANRRPGWAHLADCEIAGGVRAKVILGWSLRPDQVPWTGGVVTGTYLDKGDQGVVIVADPPLAGLQANARPDPRDLPNNHLSYAVQWFLFALTALVIYALALRKRLKD